MMHCIRGLIPFLVVAEACLAALSGCTQTPKGPADSGADCLPPSGYVAQTWPEADLLFKQDPSWRGGDAAFSVPLGSERVLWLFGDSFIATGEVKARQQSTFIRNSIGLQEGLDPSSAKMSFHWRQAGSTASSFFPEENGNWFWPLAGRRFEDHLLVFFMEVQAVSEGFGFEVIGGRAMRISNVDAAPSEWTHEWLTETVHPSGLVLGHALIVEADHLYSVAVREPGDHDAFLARWPLTNASAGQLNDPEWWTNAGWSSTETPLRIWTEGAPELSVQRACWGGYVGIHTLGFGAATVAVRTSPSLASGWTSPQSVYTPEEGSRTGVWVYAGKGHPELQGADFLVTYASNISGTAVFSDETLYYPRFVRLTIDR
jgi:hypothetical protein